MPVSRKTALAQLYQNWKACNRCSLCAKRSKVVLLRGERFANPRQLSFPRPILFVGEAPGVSEDVIGQPFVGPAGQLLDQIIERAEIWPTACAFTNIVACIPKNETGDKAQEPPLEAIETCGDRLLETVAICSPKLLVWVGELSHYWGPKILQAYIQTATPSQVKILHPAAILRMNVSQVGLAVQRSVVALAEAAEDLAHLF